MNIIIGLLLSLMFASCASPDAPPADTMVTLVNRSDTTIYYLSIGRNTSALIDIIGIVPLESNQFPALKASQEIALHPVSSYEPENGVVVFCYKAGTVEGRAVVQWYKTVGLSMEELTRNSRIGLQ